MKKGALISERSEGSTSVEDLANVYKMLRKEPHLKFVRWNDFAGEKIGRSVIAIFFGLIGTFVRVLQDDFMRFEQARDLLFRLFAPAWRSFNAGHGGYVFCHRHAHPTEQLNS